MSIKLEKNGYKKTIPTGFSWKSLLFGCLYPLCINDPVGALVQFALSFITFGVSLIFVPFIYNRKRLERMINQGWREVKD
jgi:hypothetical protein